MSDLICDACGADIPQGYRFCGQCGDPVTSADKKANQVSRSEIVHLVCPHCESQDTHELDSDSYGILECAKCKKSAEFHILQIRSKRSRGSKKNNTRSYTVRATSLSGREEHLEFDDASYTDFEMRSKDLVAFVYKKGNLVLIQNLTIRKYTKISRSSCFLASAVYGPASRETRLLRLWRDESLIETSIGRLIVNCYYRISPFIARRIERQSKLAAIIRTLIAPIIFLLRQSIDDEL